MSEEEHLRIVRGIYETVDRRDAAAAFAAYALWEVAGGRVTRLRVFDDREEVGSAARSEG